MGSVPVASDNFSAKSTVVVVFIDDEIEIKSCSPDARAAIALSAAGTISTAIARWCCWFAIACNISALGFLKHQHLKIHPSGGKQGTDKGEETSHGQSRALLLRIS